MQVTGGNPTVVCTDQNELYPERSYNAGDILLFSGYQQPTSYNWGTDWNAWNGTVLSPPVLAGFALNGDAWAASGSSTQLEYVSYILQNNATGNWCIGVGATTANAMDNGIWSYSIGCANPVDSDLDDGPSIYYDPGAARFYAVSHEIHPQAGQKACPGAVDGQSTVCLNIYNGCGVARPGSGACPQTATVAVDGDVYGHAAVVSHPATRNPIVTYRQNDNPNIKLKIFSINGAPIADHTVRDDATYDQTTTCANARIQCGAGGAVPKCTDACGTDCGPIGCWKLIPKPHVVTKYDAANQRSYAYVAFDSLCDVDGPDGGRHFKARLTIVDITNQAAPFNVAHYRSSDCATSSANDFSATVAASEFSNNVGLFFYRQPDTGGAGGPDPCATEYRGIVGGYLGLNGLTLTANLDDSTFPSMRFGSTLGMGHYTGILRRGLAGGWLFPVWSRPVVTMSADSSCPYCVTKNLRRSLMVKGTRVRP